VKGGRSIPLYEYSAVLRKGGPNMRLSRSRLFAVVTSSCGIVISGYSTSQSQQYDPNYIDVNMDHVTHRRIHTTQTTTTNSTSNSQYKA